MVQGPGRAATSRFSRSVSDGKISRSCGTYPNPAATRRYGGSRVMSPPSNRIRPLCKVLCPITVDSSVVLPTPLRPMIASVSPALTVRRMFSMITVSP